MSLSYEELTGEGLGDVVSPEQLVSQSFAYRQSAQMHGMGQGHSGDYPNGLGKKSCCSSCAHGGPCQGGSRRHPRGARVPRGKECRTVPQGQSYFPCTSCGKLRPTDDLPCPRCKKSGGWAKCGGVTLFPQRDMKKCWPGLGATTVHQGQADLEPGDYGYQYVSTTKPGTTVFGRQQGRVGVDRRMQLTRQIEELEFLAGTPNIHPRALASKVWAARRALMGAGDWAWASYADPSSRYDAKSDLEARLSAVERVLGVDQLSPRLMISYGQGSGLGGAPPWGTRMDPVKKLAQCIRGAICAPSSFCCPRGSRYTPPAGGPSRGPGVPFREHPPWIETGDPRREPPRREPPRREPPRREPPKEETIIGIPGETGVPFVPSEKTFISVNDAAGIPLEKNQTTKPGSVIGMPSNSGAGILLPGAAPAAGPAISTGAGAPAGSPAASPQAFTGPWKNMVTADQLPGYKPGLDVQAIQNRGRKQAVPGAQGGWLPGSGSANALGGLGALGARPLMNMRAINDLRASARRARVGARRRSL